MEREKFLQNCKEQYITGFYKEIYKKHPELYETPVENWEEFLNRWKVKEKGENIIILPYEAPTAMDSMFTEKDYFMKLEEDVSIVVNSRYCPPFLHSLEFIKMICVVEGNCQFYYEEKWYELEKGTICLVAPETIQTVFSKNDEDVVLNLIIRRSSFINSFSELLKNAGEGIVTDFFLKLLYHRSDGKVLICKCQKYDLIEPFIIDLYEEDCKKNKRSLSKKSLMMIILGHLVQEKEECFRHIGLNKQIRNYPMIEYHLYIKNHLDTVTLSQMANEFNVSESYLSRYIHKETGNTFRHIILEMKMNRAAELLATTDCSLERIRQLIGYSDESIFFRNFKTYYGMTPMTWRKKKQRVLL